MTNGEIAKDLKAKKKRLSKVIRDIKDMQIADSIIPEGSYKWRSGIVVQDSAFREGLKEAELGMYLPWLLSKLEQYDHVLEEAIKDIPLKKGNTPEQVRSLKNLDHIVMNNYYYAYDRKFPSLSQESNCAYINAKTKIYEFIYAEVPDPDSLYQNEFRIRLKRQSSLSHETETQITGYHKSTPVK